MMEKMLCFKCKWYVGEQTCQAFPEKIPEEIMVGQNDHSLPQKGQSGNFVFTDKNKENAGLRSK